MDPSLVFPNQSTNQLMLKSNWNLIRLIHYGSW